MCFHESIIYGTDRVFCDSDKLYMTVLLCILHYISLYMCVLYNTQYTVQCY